nr:hypothetical protein GCM10020093_008840 [Planobispora longispora]
MSAAAVSGAGARPETEPGETGSGAIWIERENPARPDEIVGAVPVADPAEVDSVVRRADGAFRDWSRLPLADRLAALTASADALAARRDALAVLLARESGKPVGDCRGEIGFAVAYLRWLCDRAPGSSPRGRRTTRRDGWRCGARRTGWSRRSPRGTRRSSWRC